MSENQLIFRTLNSIEEYERVEAIQRDIWGMTDPTPITPSHVLLTAHKNGGLVAAAFDNTEMIGFLFGFIGMTPEGKFKHCSHQMGVLPGVRRQHVGRTLKLFQRDYVRQQGLDLVTWTFDPLETVNASLNIARLGAITRTYYPNLYGSHMDDGLNKDLPSDRFQAEWWIDSPHVRQFADSPRDLQSLDNLIEQGAQTVIQTQRTPDGTLRPLASSLNLEADILLLEVPADFQAIKLVSMDLARKWRRITGEVFMHYFGRGYLVTDFVSERRGQNHERTNFYVLTRDSAEIPGIRPTGVH